MDPVGWSLEASVRLKAVIVLKGHCTVVAAPSGRYWILDGANPALATGGSGDVLAGIIAAGIAGGMTPVDAALFGVSLHATVGRLAARIPGGSLRKTLCRSFPASSLDEESGPPHQERRRASTSIPHRGANRSLRARGPLGPDPRGGEHLGSSPPPQQVHLPSAPHPCARARLRVPHHAQTADESRDLMGWDVVLRAMPYGEARTGGGGTETALLVSVTFIAKAQRRRGCGGRQAPRAAVRFLLPDTGERALLVRRSCQISRQLCTARCPIRNK